jgi:hypothetical protein
VAREGTDLDRAVLEKHTTGEHDLLVSTRDVKIPTATAIREEVGELYIVEGPCEDGELLDGLGVSLVQRGRLGWGEWEGGRKVFWEVLDVSGETMVMGVERGRGRVEMAGPAWVSEGYGVDVHR